MDQQLIKKYIERGETTKLIKELEPFIIYRAKALVRMVQNLELEDAYQYISEYILIAARHFDLIYDIPFTAYISNKQRILYLYRLIANHEIPGGSTSNEFIEAKKDLWFKRLSLSNEIQSMDSDYSFEYDIEDPNAFDEFVRLEQRDFIQSRIKKSVKDPIIIQMYYLGHTYDEISQVVGVSRQRIEQRLKNSFKK